MALQVEVCVRMIARILYFFKETLGNLFVNGIYLEKIDMGVSENSGTPKWMVYNGKPY